MTNSKSKKGVDRNKAAVEEAAAKAAESLQQAELIKVSNEIKEVLDRNGYGLQPFLIRSEFGDRPSVRLVKVNDTPNDTRTDTEEAEGGGESDESTGPESA